MAKPTSALLRLHVKPRSRQPGVSLLSSPGEVEVRVASPPEQGRANAECLQLLSDWLCLPQSCLELVSGRISRHKLVRIVGMTPAELEYRFVTAGHPGANDCCGK